MSTIRSQLIAGEYEVGGGRAVEARNPAHPGAVAFTTFARSASVSALSTAV